MKSPSKSPTAWASRTSTYQGHVGSDELIKKGYEDSGVADLISWEEFNEKQYFPSPTDPDWEKWPAGLYEFYKDPVKYPIQTPTGKIRDRSHGFGQALPG